MKLLLGSSKNIRIFIKSVLFLTFFNFLTNATPINSVTRGETAVAYQVPSVLEINDESQYPKNPMNNFDFYEPESSQLKSTEDKYNDDEFHFDYNEIDLTAMPSVLELDFKNWNTTQNPYFDEDTLNNNNIAQNPFSIPSSFELQESIPTLISSAQIPRLITEDEKKEYKTYLGYQKDVFCRSQIDHGRSPLNGVTVKIGNHTLVFAFSTFADGFVRLPSESETKLVPYPGVSGAKVSAETYNSWGKFANKFAKKILDSLSGSTIKTIIFIGFCYSGMLAQFIALELSQKLQKGINIKVITLGQQRLGNAKFALAVNKVATVIRLTYGHDPVPRQPAEYQSDKYVHSGTEIWTKSPGSFYYCSSGNEDYESKDCINKDPAKTSKDHFGSYLGVSFGNCDDSNSRSSPS
ncbi:hypothetical protein G9A89_000921 [Geosiphon pyriformis]|nr:hypothetical protein G9A89_000921 [Geosiphon pyriformis]